jgi:Protein of unknown function (DUF5132)
MSLFEDVFKGGNLLTGVGLAIGAAVLAPVIVPILRPIAKSIIKTGLIAYDQGRATLAELSEQAGDMVAEARSEMSPDTQTAPTDGDEQSAGQRSRRRPAHSPA